LHFVCYRQEHVHHHRCLDGLSDDVKQMFTTSKTRKQQGQTLTTNVDIESHQRSRILLKFKKYLFQEKTMIAQ
jgi:hypothetical protein